MAGQLTLSFHLSGHFSDRARPLGSQNRFPPVRIAHFSKLAFDFGFEIHPLDEGQLRVYSPAKTVADCFKFRSKMGTETAIQALRATYREKKATMDELWEAAKVCRVSNVLRPYMESLT